MVGERPLEQAVDEPGRERRGHDGELERARGRAGLVGEDRRRRHVSVGLDRGEELERSVPVAVEGVDPLVGRRRRAHDERRVPAALHMRVEDRARGAQPHLERRVGRDADESRRVRVEEHRRLVAGRVLELLHHQLAAPGGRGPVDASQRLALLVLADAVQLEPGGPAHDQLPPAGGAAARVREDRLEVDEPRVDEQRGRARERNLDALEAERILEDDRRGRDRVAPARHGRDDVAAREPAGRAAQHGLLLAEPRDRLARDERKRRDPALDVQLEPDVHVVAGEVLPAPERAAQPHRPAEHPHPERRGHDGEDEPDRERVERARAERPGEDVDDPSEEEQRPSAVGQHSVLTPGPRCCSTASRTTSSAERPLARASGPRISRCERTVGATAFTSSGSR